MPVVIFDRLRDFKNLLRSLVHERDVQFHPGIADIGIAVDQHVGAFRYFKGRGGEGPGLVARHMRRPHFNDFLARRHGKVDRMEDDQDDRRDDAHLRDAAEEAGAGWFGPTPLRVGISLSSRKACLIVSGSWYSQRETDVSPSAYSIDSI